MKEVCLFGTGRERKGSRVGGWVERERERGGGTCKRCVETLGGGG
jgi:hypothetical protein